MPPNLNKFAKDFDFIRDQISQNSRTYPLELYNRVCCSLQYYYVI